MFYTKSKHFIRLKPRKYKTVFKKHNVSKRRTICNNRDKFLYLCLLIMSFVVARASAITIYQNRTEIAVNDQTVDSSNHLSQFQATTSEFITTKPIAKYLSVSYEPQLNKENLATTNHTIQTNIIVGAEGEGKGGQDLKVADSKNFFGKSTENMRAKLQQLLQRDNDNDDEEKQQLQQDLRQQIQEQLQQHHLQQQQYQQSQHAILAGENAYLLERIDGGSMHEQPIYGTWSAKAKRPQAPLLAATATTTTTTTAAATATAHLQPSSSIQTLLTEVDENVYANYGQQQQRQYHHYERLPKRSSTMTPIRRELHDQIPRPPRLTSRQPSVNLRRQFSEIALPNGAYRDESRPKPFHYPFDGPLPEEFKKLQQPERGGNHGLESDSQVHNIQDILQKLNLGPGGSKVPPLMMMPTGLHISGSFKNLKSSGIGNFFRGKRNKKQIQMQFPMPIPIQMMPNPYQQSVINVMQQPYQQRIAMEQFYPFKPRSPGDINLLAMQQQQQQQQKFKNPRSKGKKHKKKQKDKQNSVASSNFMLQQYPFATAVPDMVFPSMYPPFMSINVTQAPPMQMSKRIPFKLNLDIFPVVPPSKSFKSPGGYAMDEARIASTMRSPTTLRNPFMDYLATPSAVAALNMYNPFNQKQPLYNPIRFPSGSYNPIGNMAQTSNMQIVYPEQMQKYLQNQQHQQQQQQQQQQQNLFTNFLNNQGHQTPFLPIDCDQPIPSDSSLQPSAGNSQTNPIMVHLNVFPKQKPATPLSTNPFYSNVAHLQRNTIQEESETSLSSVEPRHQGRSLNDSSPTKIERSDSTENIQQIQPLQQEDDLVDFNHPIVAESTDESADLPKASALVSDKGNLSSSSLYYDSHPNATTSSTGGINTNTNYNGDMNGNMEQMVSEARTASLFRFPVEDLIQFQVHDAM